MEGAKVSDLSNPRPEGMLLHIFLDKCPERDDTPDIKYQALEVLRQKSNSHTKLQQSDLDSFITFMKEKES